MNNSVVHTLFAHLVYCSQSQQQTVVMLLIFEKIESQQLVHQINHEDLSVDTAYRLSGWNPQILCILD